MHGTSFFAACITSLSRTPVTANSGSRISSTYKAWIINCIRLTNSQSQTHYLWHMHTGQSASIGRYIVQKQFKITNNNKLTDPAAFYRAHFWYFHISLVCSSNATRRIYRRARKNKRIKSSHTHKSKRFSPLTNTERSFCLIGWHRAHGRNFLTANRVTRKTA